MTNEDQAVWDRLVRLEDPDVLRARRRRQRMALVLLAVLLAAALAPLIAALT